MCVHVCMCAREMCVCMCVIEMRVQMCVHACICARVCVYMYNMLVNLPLSGCYINTFPKTSNRTCTMFYSEH